MYGQHTGSSFFVRCKKTDDAKAKRSNTLERINTPCSKENGHVTFAEDTQKTTFNPLLAPNSIAQQPGVVDQLPCCSKNTGRTTQSREPLTGGRNENRKTMYHVDEFSPLMEPPQKLDTPCVVNIVGQEHTTTV